MATFRAHPIKYLPDNSGNVFQEPAAVNFQANDLLPEWIWVFLDTATRDRLGVTFEVPQNYVGTPKIGIKWAAVVTTGNARLECDYVSIADAETLDPSAVQESVAVTVACPGTARLLKVTEIALTAANLAPGDHFQAAIARDGAEAGPLDTISDRIYVFDVYLSYADV